MNFIEYSYLPASDKAILTSMSVCTDRDNIAHLYKIPYILYMNNGASSTDFEMRKIDVEYDNNDFYDYLNGYFKISRCNLMVI